MTDMKMSIHDRRKELRSECGLDAFAQQPEVWLSMAIAAETRGQKTLASDFEKAMNLSLERWGGAND